MSRCKIFALVALFAFALGLPLVGDALAGWFKGRTAYYKTKWEKGQQRAFIVIKGTGKLEGTQGKGKWVSHRLTPMQRYSAIEGENVWPTR